MEAIEGNIEDFKYLIGTTHRDDDDKLLYKITRIYEFKKTGDIVGERALILRDGSFSRMPKMIQFILET